MISLRGLGVRFGQETALDGIDLEIPHERTCAVIGPSGCGKTTLLLAIAGLLRPSGGQVRIKGEALRAARRETGIILQSGGLLPWKTAWDNVALGLRVRGQDAVTVRDKVAAAMDELGILDYRDRYPAELSGGQRQRTAIARTLVLEPDLLLLDEAASSLDAINREILQNLILDLYLKRPVTLVMVTHSIEEAVYLGQTIVVMKKAAIRTIIENPYFGDKDIRSKPAYYQVCQEVRSWLGGEGATR